MTASSWSTGTSRPLRSRTSVPITGSSLSFPVDVSVVLTRQVTRRSRGFGLLPGTFGLTGPAVAWAEASWCPPGAALARSHGGPEAAA